MNKLPRLPRRVLLRGLGGTALALPWLEIMAEKNATAQAVPRRYVVLFGSFSLSPDDDTRPNLVVPSQTGARYDLKAGLKPLAPVQDHVTVVSGLKLKAVSAPDQGNAAYPVHGHSDPLFAGSTGPSANAGLGTLNFTNPTSDQIVADAIGAGTAFRSLQYNVQPSVYVTGGNGTHGNMSARKDSAGAITALVPEMSPKAAFDKLFRNFQPPTTMGMVDAQQQLDIDTRRSVLDLVDRSMKGLNARLGKADQVRLTRHWDEIRAIESRIVDLVPPVSTISACAKPTDPGNDPAVGGSISDPNGYDSSKGYSNEELRAQIFTDLVAMAFKCDLTRVVTLMHTWVQSFMNAQPIAPMINRTVHDSNHQGGPTVDKSAQLTAWHMKHYANLIEKLRSAPDINGSGSILDNTALVYLHEGGIGVDKNGVPNSHSGDQMMALIAGGAGGLRRGVHLVAPQNGTRDVGNVLITCMNAVGMNVNSLGGITGGEIAGLRG